MGLLIPPTTSAYADGSLSMPVSEDEDEDEDMERNRLEEIKEEDEGETLEKGVHRKRAAEGEGDTDSTAARVDHVSKKHKHQPPRSNIKTEAMDTTEK